MKKLLPLAVVVAVLMLFAGVVGAVVLEEPLELEEGMMGITAIMDEPVAYEGGVESEVRITAVEEEVVGSGIEAEVAITAVGEEIYTTTSVEEQRRSAGYRNYLPYAGAAAALLLLAGLMFRRKKTVTVR